MPQLSGTYGAFEDMRHGGSQDWAPRPWWAWPLLHRPGAAVLRLRAVGRLVRSKHVAAADGGVCRGNVVVGERGAERGAEHGDRRDE